MWLRQMDDRIIRFRQSHQLFTGLGGESHEHEEHTRGKWIQRSRMAHLGMCSQQTLYPADSPRGGESGRLVEVDDPFRHEFLSLRFTH